MNNDFEDAAVGGAESKDNGDWQIPDARSSPLPDNGGESVFFAGSEAELAPVVPRLGNAGFRFPAPEEDESAATASRKPAAQLNSGQGSGFIVAKDSPLAQRQAGLQAASPEATGSGFQAQNPDPVSPTKGFESAAGPDPAVGRGPSFGWSIPFDWLENPRLYKNALTRRLDWIIARKLADPKSDNVMLLIHGIREYVPFIKTESRHSEIIVNMLNNRKMQLLSDPALCEKLARKAREMGLGLNIDPGNNRDLAPFMDRLRGLTITNHPEAAHRLRAMNEERKRQASATATPS